MGKYLCLEIIYFIMHNENSQQREKEQKALNNESHHIQVNENKAMVEKYSIVDRRLSMNRHFERHFE